MGKKVVSIIMGSASDLDIMSESASTLDDFGVDYEIHALSAHRTPEVVSTYAKDAKKRGIKIIIAGAGGSAHLAGVVAAHTTLPVLSIPVKRPDHDHEALWSNIKMPPGIPLATMPKNGGKNAALLAVEILSLNDAKLAKKYDDFRQKQHDKVLLSDKELSNVGCKQFLKGQK